MPHTDSAQNMVNFGTLSNFIFGFVFLIKNVGSIDTPLDCNRYAASIINIEISLGGLSGIISVLSLVLLTRLDNLMALIPCSCLPARLLSRSSSVCLS